MAPIRSKARGFTHTGPVDLHGGIAALILAFLAPLSLGLAGPEMQRGRLSGRWMGQDGHDFVGPNSSLAPSDVQDIHIRLAGLPANRGVKHAVIRGLGGDEWQFEGPYGPWKAHLLRRPGSPTADLYLEPGREETGRGFTITITFDDGNTAEIIVEGGRADPNLRMPAARLRARWIGQDGRDRAGPGPSVGPDGIQDLVIALENLSPKIEVKSVGVRAPDGTTWQSGVNPKGHPNAELLRKGDDLAKAVLFLNPDKNRAGQKLRVAVLYANDKIDEAVVVAGPSDPRKATPSPKTPTLVANRIKARWLGQAGSDPAGPGVVKVALEGLPRETIQAAALSDPVGGTWVYKGRDDVPFEAATYPLPLTLRLDRDPTRAELAFPPIRDESGGTMSLRLDLGRGRIAFVQFTGGPADPGLRAPREPEKSTVVARPGDDLNSLANRHGTVRLSAGTYRLTQPLVLTRPVAILGDDGANLVFEQPAGGPPWTTAIKIHSGKTRLEGFSVRFAGPVRWAQDVDFGPAVIGTTHNHDQGHHDLKAGLILRKLDLESPPPTGKWEEAVRLIRLASAENGRIEGNRLRGGMVEFLGGPWHIEGNEYRGTPPGTFNYAVFAGHRTHDLVLKGNTARSAGESGKTWRFLVLTVRGANDQIVDNQVSDVGPRDTDKVSDNAPEIVLTEAYQLCFEGRPSAVASEGRLLAIPEPQGEPAEPGDAVAILDGTGAGEFRRIAQRIDRTTYLMDEPLPAGVGNVSIAAGFVGERFEGNRIDGRGGSVAAGMVLVGNHFGTRITRNVVLGCGEAMRLTAAPTEKPGGWGWSHAPFLGVTIEGNTLEDSLRGATIAVEHGPPVKSSRDRVYLSATLKDNLARWSPDFLRRREKAEPPRVFTIGEPGAADAGELRLSTSGNRVEGVASGTIVVSQATLGGRPIKSTRIELKSADSKGASETAPPRPPTSRGTAKARRRD